MRASVVPPGKVRRLPQARWWRWRQVARRWFLKAAIGAAGVLVVALGGWVAASALAGGSDSTTRVLAAVLAEQDPARAAEEATLARFDALRGEDAPPWVRWTADGSPARTEAEAAAEALKEGRMVVDGLTATIDQVTVVSAQSLAPDAALVRVSYSLSDHAVTWDGETTRFEGYSQTVDLHLVRGTAGWLVSSAGEVAEPGA